MKTCVGCGAQLDPTWKYCIYCGIAVDARELVPAGAVTPRAAATQVTTPAPVIPAVAPAQDPAQSVSEPADDAPDPRAGRAGNVALLVGGITAFLIAVALTAIAIAYAVGALK